MLSVSDYTAEIRPERVYLPEAQTLNGILHTKRCFSETSRQVHLPRNATEMYGMLQTAFGASCLNRASVFEWHKRFKEGRESVRNDERCGRSKEVKGFGLGLLCRGFKGVQEEIPSEEASTLQIGSVAFPPGQYTSPRLHPCHRLFGQDGHQDSSSPSL